MRIGAGTRPGNLRDLCFCLTALPCAACMDHAIATAVGKHLARDIDNAIGLVALQEDRAGRRGQYVVLRLGGHDPARSGQRNRESDEISCRVDCSASVAVAQLLGLDGYTSDPAPGKEKAGNPLIPFADRQALWGGQPGAVRRSFNPLESQAPQS